MGDELTLPGNSVALVTGAMPVAPGLAKSLLR